MKRSPLKSKSPRQRLTEEIEDYLRKILKDERGDRCEVCGRPNPGLFHILPKGKYPNLRFNRFNILLVCWNPCHDHWHKHRTDSVQGRRVQDKIYELRGREYFEQIQIVDKTSPKLTMSYMGLILQALKQEHNNG